jgi:(p)ppGpp synthase/HD superfamily hydrolase
MNDSEDLVIQAKKFAFEKHKNQKTRNGMLPYSYHLEGVVSRLKNLGISEKNTLCAAWLHDVIEKTDVNFDQINEIFGREVAVIVLSLTKDNNLSKKDRETQYVNQLKGATLQAKIIKLCDITANLKDITDSATSYSQKSKQIKKLIHYLRAVKNEIIENKSTYPKIQEIFDGVNIICIKFKQKPFLI